MTKEQKLVALCALLPVVGDWIEDLNDQRIFTKLVKQRANMLLTEIRRIDNDVLSTGEQEIFNQQVNLQRAFIQFVSKQIKLD
jgi:hypothetical protein